LVKISGSGNPTYLRARKVGVQVGTIGKLGHISPNKEGVGQDTQSDERKKRTLEGFIIYSVLVLFFLFSSLCQAQLLTYAVQYNFYFFTASSQRKKNMCRIFVLLYFASAVKMCCYLGSRKA
jgi:hypothetical protein